jgi:hypothetical protein
MWFWNSQTLKQTEVRNSERNRLNAEKSEESAEYKWAGPKPGRASARGTRRADKRRWRRCKGAPVNFASRTAQKNRSEIFGRGPARPVSGPRGPLSLDRLPRLFYSTEIHLLPKSRLQDEGNNPSCSRAMVWRREEGGDSHRLGAAPLLWRIWHLCARCRRRRRRCRWLLHCLR